MNAFVREVTSIVINNRSPVEITKSEAELFNSLPVNDVIPALQEIFQNSPDASIESRAFDAILKMAAFDRVQFLVEFMDKASASWRAACCRRLATFPERRAIAKLCDVLLHDDAPDVRYAAVEALAIIGDETALAALAYAAKNDTGQDYEGFRVADIAQQTLQHIRSKAES